jgi:hypothetical protein
MAGATAAALITTFADAGPPLVPAPLVSVAETIRVPTSPARNWIELTEPLLEKVPEAPPALTMEVPASTAQMYVDPCCAGTEAVTTLPLVALAGAVMISPLTGAAKMVAVALAAALTVPASF